jgi:hypothetical protein
MSDFEMKKAKEKLKRAKAALLKYLKTSYSNPTDADNMFAYFEKIVEKICTRKPYEIKISGGSPKWHAFVFAKLGVWIGHETLVGEMLFDQLEATFPEAEDSLDDYDLDFESTEDDNDEI